MTPRYAEIEACRICGNRHLDSVFHLGIQHLTGVFPKTAESQRELTSGPLELVKCRSGPRGCGLLQLRQSFSPPEMYGANYGYRSSLNRSMVEHLQTRVRRVTGLVRLQPGDLVLDIGSNDGTLLKAYAQSGLDRVGMDPTGDKFRRYYPPDIRLVADFFSLKAFKAIAGPRRAKVVTSIAMFYDLEDPMDFVRQVGDILAPDGVWVFEQSYMPAMLQAGSYDTICHEHIEYYALSQIKWMMDRAGMKIVGLELNDVNGGSFAVTVAKADSPLAADEEAVAKVLAEERAAGLDDMEPYEAFQHRVLLHRSELTGFIRSINAGGQKILGYGASTKGNVILQYCGLTSRDLPCIAEVNEDKFGAVTPGTAIPIVSEREAKAMKPDYLLVLPWHFRDNIIARERDYLRGGGKLVFPLPGIEVVGVGAGD